jgi:hypothetical protein
LTSGDVCRSLKYLCDTCSDHPEEEFCLRQYADFFLKDYKTINCYKWLIKLPCIGKLFVGTLSEKIYFNYEFKRTLIECCEEIIHELHEMLDTLDYKKEINCLIDELNHEIIEFILLQQSMTKQMPELVKFIKTKRASYHILQFQKNQINHFEHLGLVTEKDKDI